MVGLNRRELFTAAGLAAANLAVSCARPNTQIAAPRSALDELAGKLRGTVVRPGDTGYDGLATPRNLRFAASMPEAVVLTADTHDVSETIAWTRNTGTAFAIRGGGHNYAAGSSSAGILIMTRTMNRAAVDGTTLRAQAGVRNAEVAELLARGGGRLLLPGGNCPGVGIAGLTLGGGIGPNAPWAGLTADRLRKATMVTADGRVVEASAVENPDLFWGLRGGAGGNFGLVTELEYALVEVPVTRATTVLLQCTGRDAAVRLAVEFQKLRAEHERTVTGTVNLEANSGDVKARARVQALLGENDTRDILAAILAIPELDAEITERPWWDAYAWYSVPPKPSYLFWDRSLYADDFLPADALADATEVIRRFPAASGPDRRGGMGLFGWVGGAVNDLPPDATAYVHRAARILLEMSTSWQTPAATSLPVGAIPTDIKEWEEELWNVLLPHTNGHSYQNFPDPELTDWATAYYGENLTRLSALKAAWDPERVFTYPQGIPLPG